MDVSVSELIVEDLEQCARLFVEAFAAPPWQQRWTHDAAVARLDDVLSSGNALGLKASDRGKIAGFIVGETEAWNASKLFLIKELCVAASEQRKGIGRRLVDVLMNRLPPQVEKAYLLTERESPARLFYASLGFSTNDAIVVTARDLNERS